MEILSITLAVFAIILSFLFYRESQKDSKRIEDMATNIEKKTEVQYELVKQISEKTLSMIDSYTNNFMKLAIEKSGSFGDDNRINYEMEIFMSVSKEKKVSIKSLQTSYGLDKRTVDLIIQKLINRDLICKKGEYLYTVNKEDHSSLLAVSSDRES